LAITPAVNRGSLPNAALTVPGKVLPAAVNQLNELAADFTVEEMLRTHLGCARKLGKRYRY